MTNVLKKTMMALLLPFVLVLVWQLFSQMGWLNNYLLPPPSGIIDQLFALAHHGTLLKHLSASLYRVGCGFGLAFFLALPLGFLLGLVPRAQDYLSPFLNFLQQIPAIAWIPMFILWLGIDETSKISIITYSGFFPIFLNTMHGISNTDSKLKEVASTFGLSPWQIIVRVYLPSAAPSVFVGMRLGLSFCWRSLVAAELLGASKGIGYLIQEGRELAQPDLMLAGVLMIGLTGLFLDFLFLRLEKTLLPWRDTQERREVPKWQPF
ncbi:putative aliphatic sulfonates transport permease protein SsuC [Desulfosporosinus acididurans]|uniref:Putative aliphatic sulfonates transport permease protein SsuC n=1 Tax=Desulfosporosinus acididurans TaxID=476652 RepID=A0A0J1FP80_9FIRM|nr:ABC transporter permease [Desulfosporosinus acididurans]KLU65112.1 putative aliphatic sulfonates transport permease protein SsuC [Desulfosporosinus acididurans]